jgi:hypothetical protein
MRAVDITPRVEEESRDDAPGDRLYLSNSARHSTSALGARSHSNFQSVIDSPLLVSRVAPPRTTREKTQTHPPASHAATAFSANAPPRTSGWTNAGVVVVVVVAAPRVDDAVATRLAVARVAAVATRVAVVVVAVVVVVARAAAADDDANALHARCPTEEKEEAVQLAADDDDDDVARRSDAIDLDATRSRTVVVRATPSDAERNARAAADADGGVVAARYASAQSADAARARDILARAVGCAPRATESCRDVIRS